MIWSNVRTQSRTFLRKVIFETPWFWGLMFLTLIPVFGLWFFSIREQLYQGNLPREPFYEEHQNAIANDLAKVVKFGIVSTQEIANIQSVSSYQMRLQALSGFAITDPSVLENLSDGERLDLERLNLERFENYRNPFDGIADAVFEDKFLENLDLDTNPKDQAHQPGTCEEVWAARSTEVKLPINQKSDPFLLESNRRNERQSVLADSRSRRNFLKIPLVEAELPNSPIATTGDVTQIGIQHLHGLDSLRFNFVHDGILEAEDGTQFALIDDLSVTDVEVTDSGKLVATIGYQLYRAPYIKTRFYSLDSITPLIVDREEVKNTEVLHQIMETEKATREIERSVFEARSQIWTTESLEISLAPIPIQKTWEFGDLSCPVTSIRLNCRPSSESADFCSSFVLPKLQDTYGYDPRDRSVVGLQGAPTWALMEPVLARMSILVAAQNGLDSDSSSAFIRMMYFSIVNMTTLGYGDIVPITTYARTLVGLQSVLGVIFIGFFLNAFANRHNQR